MLSSSPLSSDMSSHLSAPTARPLVPPSPSCSSDEAASAMTILSAPHIAISTPVHPPSPSPNTVPDMNLLRSSVNRLFSSRRHSSFDDNTAGPDSPVSRRGRRKALMTARLADRLPAPSLPRRAQVSDIAEDMDRMPDRPRNNVPSRVRTSSPIPVTRSLDNNTSDIMDDHVLNIDDSFHDDEPTSSSSLSPRSYRLRRARDREPKSSSSSASRSGSGFGSMGNLNLASCSSSGFGSRSRLAFSRLGAQSYTGGSVSMGDVLCSTGVDQATLGLRMRRQRRHNTHESVRMGARRIVRQLENCESGSTAEMSVQTLGEFAFAVTDALQLLERQEALDDSGALRRLVEVQARFLKYSRVQTLCSSILGSLRVDENFGGLKIGVKLCVETIVGSMRMHCKDRRVVREGLRALCSLSRLEEVRFQMLGESNGIETAINGMEAHAADVAVQCEGTRFLSYACVESESNKTCITRHGGTQRVVAAMCEHVDSNRLQLFGCKLVRNITVQREDLVEACEESGCVEAIIDALQRHGEARGVAIQSLTALQHVLCREETGQRVLQHQGAEWAVMEAARRHFACVQIVTLSLAIAGRIASAGGAVASKRLVRAGAMAVALDGMERFVKRRGVLFFGARLVRRLLETGDGMEEVNVWGGVPRLLDILYCTAATPVSEEETFGGYTDLFIDT